MYYIKLHQESMDMSLFVVVLRYIQDINMVNQVRDEHLSYIHECYKDGWFLLSGPLEPRTGGVILAQAKSRKDLLKVIHKDPFYKQSMAEFSIYEFLPSRHHPNLTFFSQYL